MGSIELNRQLGLKTKAASLMPTQFSKGIRGADAGLPFGRIKISRIWRENHASAPAFRALYQTGVQTLHHPLLLAIFDVRALIQNTEPSS
jgi:hypothetical protein